MKSTQMAQISRHKHALPILVFLTTIVVSVAFWAALPVSYSGNMSADFQSFYAPVAYQILDGGGLYLDGKIATRTPPGFPLILAGVFGFARIMGGSEQTFLYAFILLCSASSAVLLFQITRIYLSPYSALLTSLLWITYLPALWLGKQPNSEVAFLVFFYAAIFFFLKLLESSHPQRRMALAIGLLVGAAMLIRPFAIGLGVVLAGLILALPSEWRWRARLQLSAWIILGNLAAVAPWEIWVYLNSGSFILLSTTGTNSIRDGLFFAISGKSYRAVIPVSTSVRMFMEIVSEQTKAATSSLQILAMVARISLEQPFSAIQFFLLKAARSWYGTDSQQLDVYSLFLQIPYTAAFVCGSLAAWRRNAAFHRCVLVLWAVLFYHWGMTILVLSIFRYMLPAVGLLFVFIPFLLQQPIQRIERRFAFSE